MVITNNCLPMSLYKQNIKFVALQNKKYKIFLSFFYNKNSTFLKNCATVTIFWLYKDIDNTNLIKKELGRYLLNCRLY